MRGRERERREKNNLQINGNDVFFLSLFFAVCSRSLIGWRSDGEEEEEMIGRRAKERERKGSSKFLVDFLFEVNECLM